jgi:alkaline phosphatase D
LYNRYDANVRRFSAEIPQIWQWDDHEVTNNWSDAKLLDERYTTRSVRTLTANASRAFHEYAPLRSFGDAESERVYRHIPYGPDIDLFVLDMRSYRGPNSFNRQESASADTALLGAAQLAWLKASLANSRAVWKIIASDMPLGLVIDDGQDSQGRPRFEGPANGDGLALGRELEIADLLSFIKRQDIGHVVWITADVHYCAAHRYDPQRAQFRDFAPFWEFVAGPLNAGSFGPAPLDNTFGPQVVFQKPPPAPNTPPTAGYQFFGQLDFDAESRDLIVSLKDIDGATVFAQRLSA